MMRTRRRSRPATSARSREIAMQTLADLFIDTDKRQSAIILPEDGTELGYGSLSDQVDRLATRLRQSGLDPGQVVAIALPNGIEYLVAFLATTRARLVAAPMNPAYKAAEFRFFLEDSEARIVITTSGADPVREGARALRLPVWTATRNATGDVQLAGPGFSSSTKGAPDMALPGDIALLTHTSGTTGRPKAVPLTHANVMAAVHNISAYYQMSLADTGLVVMPLFHGHGLIGATLSALFAGAKLVLPNRFSAHAFWPLVKAHAVTWYSAVPTMNDDGELLQLGNQGEVVVRGATVMHGYYRNPDANKSAFANGWFRTGDLGVLDSDGYLRLTGRIKELINRGGEKLSPTEIDAVLLGNPAVAEAASFGVPDRIYGEEVQAAVVLRADITAAELQAYCRSRLADFEIPKVIHFVKELPKDATGKVERPHLTALFSN